MKYDSAVSAQIKFSALIKESFYINSWRRKRNEINWSLVQIVNSIAVRCFLTDMAALG